MTQIIAAHFNSVEELQAVVDTLPARGFGADDYATYFLNPPGQRGLYWLGGDAVSDEGASGAGRTAAVGALVGGGAGVAAGSATGFAIGSVGGPVGALAGAGVGAYLGALVGALRGMQAPDPEEASVEHPAEPQGGPMIALNVERPGAADEAIALLHEGGAHEVHRTEGRWANGEWVDFDPREPIEHVQPGRM